MANFLAPSDYVRWAKGDPLAKKAAKLVAKSETETLRAIYGFVAGVRYDYAKADRLRGTKGYKPDLAETFESMSGICVDKAALMVAMLRSVGIESKLITGTLDDVPHAWVSAKVDGRWRRCDPTMSPPWDEAEMCRHKYVARHQR